MISTLSLVFPIIAATLSRAETHAVAVGGPNLLTFDPPTVVAAVGDTIQFVFHEKNHTATQSAFGSPCSPLAGPDGSTAGSNNGLFGFNSGFMPVAAGTTEGFPTYEVPVNDTKPLWFYCQQTVPSSHCQQGMVFAVNAPTEGNTFEAFKAAAMASNASTTTSATTEAPSSTAWTSPPPPVVETVTATVTVTAGASAGSVYTTTYASWEGASADPTPAATPAVHTIVVGGTAGLVFTPSTVDASIGDTIVFEFQSKNHSATQSLFNSPCSSVAKATNGTQIGFDSGFMPVDANATTFPTFNYTVNVTTPVWGYCRQQGPPVHCQQGMVFGINAPKSGANTFTAFQLLAEHTNVTAAGSAGNGTGAGAGNNTKPANGVGRAAVPAGLGLGVLSAIFASLL